MSFFEASFSTAFRISSFLFLRVIPSPILQAAISVFFSFYLLFASRPLKRARRELNPIYAILFSLTSPSRYVRWANTIINALTFFAVVEFVATPFVDSAHGVVFARVGAVSSDSAKISVRYPQLNESVYVVYRESKPNATWSTGPSLVLSADNDWAETVSLSGLWPSTKYEYALSSTNSTLLSYPATPLSFRTFPDSRLPGGTHFRFVTSSCILPNFPYTPFHGRTLKGFDLLADYLFPQQSPLTDSSNTTSPAPSLPASFLLFLGDFIYADVPFYIGNSKEAYRRLYRRNYQSSSFRKIYEKLPIFHTYDDHEILNNFSGSGNDSTPPFPSASNAFEIYNARANPSPPPSTKSLDHTPYYYDFRYGDVAFFMLDTRRYRSFDTVPKEERTMLGDDQLRCLIDWMAKANSTATFKFIVSSVPFTSLWGHDAQKDSWAGFPSEKRTLLEAMHSVPNVIVLSGDRHEFAAIEFTGQGHAVTEFSTSPLSMFYIPLVRTLSLASSEMVSKQVTRQITRQVPKLSIVDAPAAVFEGVAENNSVAENEASENSTSSDSPVDAAETEVSMENVTVVETEEVPKERVVKYIPQGNFKWSSIEIDTRDAQRPTLKLEVIIDGKPAFDYEIIGTPVKLQSSNALGAFVASSMKDIFNKFGMQPRKWF